MPVKDGKIPEPFTPGTTLAAPVVPVDGNPAGMPAGLCFIHEDTAFHPLPSHRSKASGLCAFKSWMADAVATMVRAETARIKLKSRTRLTIAHLFQLTVSTERIGLKRNRVVDSGVHSACNSFVVDCIKRRRTKATLRCTSAGSLHKLSTTHTWSSACALTTGLQPIEKSKLFL